MQLEFMALQQKDNDGDGEGCLNRNVLKLLKIYFAFYFSHCDFAEITATTANWSLRRLYSPLSFHITTRKINIDHSHANYSDAIKMAPVRYIVQTAL